MQEGRVSDEAKGGPCEGRRTHKDAGEEASDDHAADEPADDRRDARRPRRRRCQIRTERHQDLRRHARDADEEAQGLERLEVRGEGLAEGEESGDDDEKEEEGSSREEVAEWSDEDEAARRGSERGSVSRSRSRAPLFLPRLAEKVDGPDEVAALQERRDAGDLLVVDLELDGELDEDGLDDVEVGDGDSRAERQEPVERFREDERLAGHAAPRNGEEAEVASAPRSSVECPPCARIDAAVGL